MAACGTEPASPPNVVLITVDTLRADRIGAYGSVSTRTPHVDRLAREGLLFENAVAAAPLTRPSHFSLFTSVYPRDHGCVNNRLPLPDDVALLPERFRDAGYEAVAITATAGLLGRGSGLERGFDRLMQSRATQETADRVVHKARRWLDRRTGERPFFLWLHLFDPHMPYEPPPRFRPEAESALAAALPTVNHARLAEVAEAHGDDLPKEAYERAVALYGGEVEHVDHWIGALREELEARRLLDRTVLVFTADHGECFENGSYFEHSNCLYEGAVRVPLIMRYSPSIPAGTRRRDVVQNLDVGPTLLALSGLAPAPSFMGRDLLGPSRGDVVAVVQHPLPPPGVHARRALKGKGERSVMGRPSRPMTTDVEELAVRAEEWKYIQRGDVEELYHLPDDPTESEDLASERPEVLGRLRARLEAWKEDHPLRVQDQKRIHPELLDQLRELGYVD